MNSSYEKVEVRSKMTKQISNSSSRDVLIRMYVEDYMK